MGLIFMAQISALKAERDDLARRLAGLQEELQLRMKEVQEGRETIGRAGIIRAKLEAKLADAERRAEEHCCELETQEFRLQNDREWKEKVDYQKQRAEKAEQRAREHHAQTGSCLTCMATTAERDAAEAQNAGLRAALESLAADIRRWNLRDAMPDMSGKLKGWRYPQLEIYVERALKPDGSASECLSCGRPLAWDGKKYSHADESHDHEPIASDGSALGDVLAAAEKHYQDAPVVRAGVKECSNGCDICEAVRRYRKERDNVDPSTPGAGCGACPECAASGDDPERCTWGPGKERGDVK